MSTPSIRASTYSCSHPLINGENAPRLQSARVFDPTLTIAANTIRDANDPYSGRPSTMNAMNGVYGLQELGFAGLNPNPWILHETALRSVAFFDNDGVTNFYDTINGANRGNWSTQFAGKSGTTCGALNGPQSYENTGNYNNQYGQIPSTDVDRRNYMAALQSAYRSGY